MDALNPFHSDHPHRTGAPDPAWALVPGEDQDAYAELHQELLAAVQPTDALERVWFEDVVALVWERRRRAALQAHILARGRRSALWRLLGKGMNPKSVAGRRLLKLIERALAGDEAALAHIERSLKREGHALTAVLSEAYDGSLEELQQVDALIAGCERRRDRLLREVERRRACYAARLRMAASAEAAGAAQATQTPPREVA